MKGQEARSEMTKKVGLWLRSKSLSADLSVEDAAHRMSVPKENIELLEEGRIYPPLKLLSRFVGTYNVAPMELVKAILDVTNERKNPRADC